jgi:hypothetical protein
MDELPHTRRFLDAARAWMTPGGRRAQMRRCAKRSRSGLVDLPPLAARSAFAPRAGLRCRWRQVALGLGAVAVLAAGIWQLRLRQSAACRLRCSRGGERARRAAGGPGARGRFGRRRPRGRAARAASPLTRTSLPATTTLRASCGLAAVDGMLRHARYRDALRR